MYIIFHLNHWYENKFSILKIDMKIYYNINQKFILSYSIPLSSFYPNLLILSDIGYYFRQ